MASLKQATVARERQDPHGAGSRRNKGPSPAVVQARPSGETAPLRGLRDPMDRAPEHLYQTLLESAPVGIALTNEEGRILGLNRRLRAMTGYTSQDLSDTPVTEMYADLEDRKRLLRMLRLYGRVEHEEVWFRRRNGSLFLGVVGVERIVLSGKPVLMAIVQDITRQREAEEHLQGMIDLLKLFAVRRSRRDYLKRVVDLLCRWCDCRCAGIRLLDGEGGMPYVAHTGFGRRFIQNECAFALTDKPCACTRVLTGKARVDDSARTTPQGSVFCNHVTQLAHEISGNPGNCLGLACVQAGFESLAQTPIRYRGRLVGTIHLADPRPNRFPRPIMSFVESVAPLLGEAVERFQVEASLSESELRFRSMFERHNAVMLLIDPETGSLVDANPAAAAFYGYPTEKLRTMNVCQINCLPKETVAAHRQRAGREHRNFFVFPQRLANGEIRTVEVHSSPIQAQGRELLFSIIHDITERKLLEKKALDVSEKERQRVGRDLHDSLGGRLTGAALMAKALAQRLAAKSKIEAAVAEEVVLCINECITQTRSIARGLCPIELSVSGLSTALQELASETQRRTGIACQAQAAKRVQVKDHFLASHVFRIAQEALNNAVRHAHPSLITISLARQNGDLCLRIRDNGKGLRSLARRNGGLGLRTMRYRALLLGGSLQIHRGKAGGTTVTCTVPLTPYNSTPSGSRA